jgi:molybdopterin adenylyltransferase
MKPRIVTITVSDTRTFETDGSGKALAEELSEFTLIRHHLVRDEPDAIREVLDAIVSRDEADAVVLTGGTGISPRDRTYEAVEGRLDKRLEGFGEAFRRLSWEQIGARAMLSRAIAGTSGQCLLFVIPGSVNAARLAARQLIAPILDHAIDVLRRTGTHGAPA